MATIMTLPAHDVAISKITNIEHAVIEIRDDFLDLVEKLQKLCLENDLTQARVWFEPDAWGPASVNVEESCLVVGAFEFWLRGRTSEFEFVETEPVAIAALIQQYRS